MCVYVSSPKMFTMLRKCVCGHECMRVVRAGCKVGVRMLVYVSACVRMCVCVFVYDVYNVAYTKAPPTMRAALRPPRPDGQGLP